MIIYDAIVVTSARVPEAIRECTMTGFHSASSRCSPGCALPGCNGDLFGTWRRQGTWEYHKGSIQSWNVLLRFDIADFHLAGWRGYHSLRGKSCDSANNFYVCSESWSYTYLRSFRLSSRQLKAIRWYKMLLETQKLGWFARKRPQEDLWSQALQNVQGDARGADGRRHKSKLVGMAGHGLVDDLIIIDHLIIWLSDLLSP